MEDSIVKMMELARIEPDKAIQKHSKGAAFDSGFERADKNNDNDDNDEMFEKEYCTDIELDGSSFCWSDEESTSMQWLSRRSSVAALASNIFSTEFYSVLSSSHIRRKQVDLITSVAESLAIPFDDAESMLCYCQWKPDHVQVEYLASPIEIGSKAGVYSPRVDSDATFSFSMDVTEADASLDTNKTPKVCGTAFCGEVAGDDCFQLVCGHTFCNDCWRGFLVSEFEHGRSCLYTRCPGFSELRGGKMMKCSTRVPCSVMEKFLDKDSMMKYMAWFLNSFVECTPSLKWCIRPECDYAIEYDGSGPSRPVTCSCKQKFCFDCSSESHRPVPCDIMTNWREKASSEQETERWIDARTKPCPKCKVRIEKNRACNHMICSNCSHHFCWLCKRDWSEHDVEKFGFYKCNVYDDETSRQLYEVEEKDMGDATRHMQKYMFYYNRFQHQQQARSDTLKFMERIEDVVPEIEEIKQPLSQQANFYHRLVSVVRSLAECQEILGRTHCLAYFLQQGNQKHLLEHQQGILESMTEKLSFMISSIELLDLFSSNNTDTQEEIVRVGNTARKFAKELLESCESDAFDVMLLNTADDEVNMWACTICTTENTRDSLWCCTCGACRKHGEQECRAAVCRNPMTPHAPVPHPHQQQQQQQEQQQIGRFRNMVRQRMAAVVAAENELGQGQNENDQNRDIVQAQPQTQPQQQQQQQHQPAAVVRLPTIIARLQMERMQLM